MKKTTKEVFIELAGNYTGKCIYLNRNDGTCYRVTSKKFSGFVEPIYSASMYEDDLKELIKECKNCIKWLKAKK